MKAMPVGEVARIESIMTDEGAMCESIMTDGNAMKAG
jgi:hypothetical protein